MAAFAQLAGQDGVVGGKEASSGKLENEVLGGQDQDQQRGDLDGDEGGRVAEHVAGQLGDQGGVAVGEGAGVEAGGQEGDADEQEGHDGGHADQGGAGVALWALKADTLLEIASTPVRAVTPAGEGVQDEK